MAFSPDGSKVVSGSYDKTKTVKSASRRKSPTPQPPYVSKFGLLKDLRLVEPIKIR
jgi:hypothetical protein